MTCSYGSPKRLLNYFQTTSHGSQTTWKKFWMRKREFSTLGQRMDKKRSKKDWWLYFYVSSKAKGISLAGTIKSDCIVLYCIGVWKGLDDKFRMDLKGSWTELGSFLDYECMPDYTMYVKLNQFISAVFKYKMRIKQCMRLHYGILGMSMID